ncbi:hypothetical protein D4A47_00340 [Anaerotruncus massiliensis (ex Liu et al. 2021)]|uniref:Discoidin domain-containing protein n=2 Tax=Anaerotruncus TaxID=244127 RepID=A0A498CSA2_9FIRM|nr:MULTISPECIES: hypothetical protein [Anaerotruncus]MBC3937342.1 hypothetical protein [Anaerotruncus massiliensis (ex Togo et al. 2019)]RLL14470.1 hypothetical protein D4A47_00340 [Anaerotruncus massiliensis (ex Liu et al. 2021)]
MRKRAFVGLAGILCAFALTVPVFAAFYVDDCDSLAPDGTRSYGGFSEAVGDFDVFSGWGTCGDATALAVGGREAQATYRVSGAESVEVSFYASLSTCATPYGKDAFTLGGQSAEALLNARRCFYDRAADVVFLTENGRNFSLQYDPFYGLLLREDGRPLSDDCFWGLNLSVSRDGSDFTPLRDVTLARVESQWLEVSTGRYYRETCTARLPEGTRYVRAAFEDFRSLEEVPDRTRAFLLARVRFDGDALTPGGSGSEESSSVPGEESSSVPDSSSRLPMAGGGGGSASGGGSGGRLLRERREAGAEASASAALDEGPAAVSPRTAGERGESASRTEDTSARPERREPEPSGGVAVYRNLGGGDTAGPSATPQEKFGGMVGGGAGLYILLSFLRGVRR